MANGIITNKRVYQTLISSEFAEQNELQIKYNGLVRQIHDVCRTINGEGYSSGVNSNKKEDLLQHASLYAKKHEGQIKTLGDARRYLITKDANAPEDYLKANLLRPKTAIQPNSISPDDLNGLSSDPKTGQISIF